MPAPSDAAIRELVELLGAEHVLTTGSIPAHYSHDASVARGLRAAPDALVLPGTAEEVAEVLGVCYRNGIPLVPRGGGTGLAGGAVATAGGVLCSLERLTRVREFTPSLWRMHAEAGVTTSRIKRLARENGLLFPPDPGAAEESQIGGNVATNAGGPHAFKYGTTGAWVTGLEAAIAPGKLIRVGGPIRKDVAGYDLKHLLIGSEGTLAIITAVWLRLIPAPERVAPVVAFFPGAHEGCEAITEILGTGLQPATLDFLDASALAAVRGAYPAATPDGAGFVLLIELDGSVAEVERQREELFGLLAPLAVGVETVSPAELWRWRDGVSAAVTTQRGGKVGEDIVVPLDRLEEAIERVPVLGERHGLPACSWGHAGDGNIHGTFMIDPGSPEERDRAQAAAGDLFALAVELGGSISGEHGLGYVKGGQLALQWSHAAIEVHERIKHCLDPEGLLNPGKKVARPVPG